VTLKVQLVILCCKKTYLYNLFILLYVLVCFIFLATSKRGLLCLKSVKSHNFVTLQNN